MQITGVPGEVAQLLGVRGRCSMKLPGDFRIYLSSETYPLAGTDNRARNRSCVLRHFYEQSINPSLPYIKNDINILANKRDAEFYFLIFDTDSLISHHFIPHLPVPLPLAA